ncbi:hypothetical protein ACIB24_17630 [Spongisporangium articulatum]|uniref:Uncharacterized protein n=1 Tax=Spongisporangium articulatum TaxID=3362603 RepID=A0ABW8AS20_9ACTN
MDAGFAMMLVLISMSVLMLFMTVSLAAVIQNSVPSRADQDSKAAVAAAQGGIEEYLGRLQNDSEYWRRNNVDSTNSAFDTAGTYLPGNTSGAKYSYRVLNSISDIDAGNPIQLEVTGISSPSATGKVVKRVLRAQLQKTGTSGAWTPQYAYFSDYEVGDPSQFASANSKCGNYYYGTVAGTASSSGRNSVASNATACPEIPWLTGDAVTGQIVSNDPLYIPGNPTFSVKPKSAWAGASSKWYWGSGTPSQTSQTGTVVSNLPSDNTYLLKDVNPRPDGGDPGPGCLYKGATKITFSGTSFTVYSPGTTTTTTGCFNATNASAAQTFTSIPPVIYVQSSTNTSCGSLGYPASNEYVSPTGYYTDATGGVQYTPSYACTRGTAYVSGTVNGNVTVGTENDIVVGGDLTTANTTTNMVGLNAGQDVWVYHPLKANTTTSTVGPTTQTGVSSCTTGTSTTGNTTTTITCSSQYCTSWFIFCLAYGYDKTTTTVTTSSSYANLLTTPVTTIQASILTGSGSFLVQNFNRGAAISTTTTNRLAVTGSISQKWRGPISTISSTGATISTGYLANYTLDSRLPNQVPPYFIDPGLATWSLTRLTDG